MLRKLRIRNVRIHPAAGISLEISRRISVLTGENGEGKSTVLDSIAFLSGAYEFCEADVHRSAEGHSAGWLSVSGELERDGKRIGLHRSLGSAPSRSSLSVPVIRIGAAGRCEVRNPFADSEAVRLAAERMLRDRFTHSAAAGGVEERGGICQDRPIAWDELSSGYRAMAGLAATIARSLTSAYGDTSQALQGEGIALIDEVELHLHPRLQRVVCLRLAELFPAVQFFITTHSAVAALGASSLADVVRVDRTEADSAVSGCRSVEHLDVGALLRSEIFGLPGVYAPQWDAPMERRDEILGMPHITADLERELDALDRLLERVDAPATPALLRAARFLSLFAER